LGGTAAQQVLYSATNTVQWEVMHNVQWIHKIAKKG